jgi:hypothetical protein
MYVRGMPGCLVALAVPIVIILLIWWLSRSGGKLIAAENAALAAIATARGLTVKPLPNSLMFSADGTIAGVTVRVATEYVDKGRGHRREVLRVVARPLGPRPAIMIRRRDEAGIELGPSFHELPSGEAAFDALFTTSVEDDAAATDFMASLRPDLVALGAGPLSSGVHTFKCGSEIVLVMDCTFDKKAFTDGRAAKAIDLILRIAS